MKIIYRFRNRCKEWCLENKKQFLFLLTIYLLAFTSIIRANVAYVDDIGRTYAGYHGWLDWSRYGTEALATLVHAGWHLTDISPLPQIIACIIMAVGGILLADIFKGENKIGLWSILAVSMTALGPYFLGMISYKFDSPYMALSFLISILPFCFRRESKKVFAGISVICLLMMCMTYQASSGIYPLIAVFLALESIIKGEKVKKVIGFLGISAVCYLVSLGVFWIFLMRENGVTMFSAAQVIPNAVRKYAVFYEAIYHDFAKPWLVLLVFLILFFLLYVYKTTEINKVVGILLGIVTVIIGSVFCFGAFLFISREAYDTRVMYGFNILLALLAVFISYNAKCWFPKMACAGLVWSFFVFSLTYGNALVQQQRYADYRLDLVAADLNGLEVMRTDEVKEIQVVGDIGLSPVIISMAEDYPILNRMDYTRAGEELIIPGFGEGIWGEYRLLHYLKIPNIKGTSKDYAPLDMPVIKDTMYHTIRGEENCIVIELR